MEGVVGKFCNLVQLVWTQHATLEDDRVDELTEGRISNGTVHIAMMRRLEELATLGKAAANVMHAAQPHSIHAVQCSSPADFAASLDLQMLAVFPFLQI